MPYKTPTNTRFVWRIDFKINDFNVTRTVSGEILVETCHYEYMALNCERKALLINKAQEMHPEYFI